MDLLVEQDWEDGNSPKIELTSKGLLVDKFSSRGSSVSSTETDIDTRLAKAWTANDRISVVWKSYLTDKTKHSFFQAAVVSIQLYGCTMDVPRGRKQNVWRKKLTAIPQEYCKQY